MSGDQPTAALPDWAQAIADRVEDRGTRVKRAVTVDLSPDEMRVVREAARLRDISVAAYLRRCALAVAAHDLGVPFAVLTAHEAKIARHGVPETGREYHGTGFGPWKIGSME